MKRKRILAVLFFVIITAVWGGCATEQRDEPAAAENQEENLDDSTEENSDNEQEEMVSGEETEEDGNKESAETSGEQSQTSTVTVYTVDSAEELQKQEIVVDEKTPEALWKVLANCAVVPAESQVISMQSDEGQIQLDVSSEFGEFFRSLGTSGEQNVISCVVNSYLDTFNGSRIKITEEGNVLVSGHKEYADFMEKTN